MRRIEMHVICIKYSKFNILSVATLKECFVLCDLYELAFEMWCSSIYCRTV